MPELIFQAKDLTKTFSRRRIFSGISFVLGKSDSLAITGKNGSGKTTLLKILAGVLSPSRGSTEILSDGSRIKDADRFLYLGLVSPYLQLYDEFTAWENLDIFRKVRDSRVPESRLDALLERVRLSDRKGDPVRTYSSGMKQRLKYAFALIHDPPVLLLDEPASNLDREGISTVYGIIEEQKKKGIVIIATNDAEDLKYSNRIIDLDLLKAGGAS